MALERENPSPLKGTGLTPRPNYKTPRPRPKHQFITTELVKHQTLQVFQNQPGVVITEEKLIPGGGHKVFGKNKAEYKALESGRKKKREERTPAYLLHKAA